jgi:hypothetical protein
MSVYGAKVTVGRLFDLLYDEIEDEIENPEYKEPHPSCLHYQTLEEMNHDIFCPKCGTQNKRIEYPRFVQNIYYQASSLHDQYFYENKLPRVGKNKTELIRVLLRYIYSSGGYNIINFDRKLYLSARGNEEGYIEITATGDDRERSFVWFHKNYDEVEGPGCYWGFDKVLEKSSGLSNYVVYLICYRLDDIVSSSQLETALNNTRLFEKLALDVEQLTIEKFNHPD